MKVQIRADGTMQIEGYVNVTCRNSRPLMGRRGMFIEQIMTGAFGNAIKNATESIGLMFNHQRFLGNADDGSITELYEDNIGLYAKTVVTDPEVVEEARAGNLTGWSFGFVPIQDRWEEGEDVDHRYIEELDLVEVSILTVTPAYIATSIEARGEKQVLVEHRWDAEDVEIEVEEPEKAEEEKRGAEEIDYELESRKRRFELLKLKRR